MSDDLTELTRDDLLEYVTAVEDQLHIFRSEVRRLDELVLKARAVVAQKINQWQCGNKIITPEQNMREHLKSEQEKRRLRAAGLLPTREQPAVANSMIDHMRAPGPIGPNSAAYYRQRNGFNRGAFPRQARGVKLPSQR
jgi:hypothetical protein